jgi:hypothetical protein
VRAEYRYASAEVEAPDKNPKQRGDTHYDGTNTGFGFKSGDMGGVGGGHGHWLWPETNQVVKESSVADKSLFGSEESPRNSGALTFIMGKTYDS